MIGWFRISAISFLAAAAVLLAFVGGFVTASRYRETPTEIEWEMLKGSRFALVSSAVLKTLAPGSRNDGPTPQVIFAPARRATLFGGAWDFRDALTFRFYNADGSVGPSGWAVLAGSDSVPSVGRTDMVWIFRDSANPLMVEFDRFGNITDVDS